MATNDLTYLLSFTKRIKKVAEVNEEKGSSQDIDEDVRQYFPEVSLLMSNKDPLWVN